MEKTVIKRIMPRQNELVNEIWICDKGRFGYHYTESKERLQQPLMRKNGQLEPVAWDEALDEVSSVLCREGSGLVTLVGGKLSNEDLYNLYQLTRKQGGRSILNSTMAGGDLVNQVGLESHTDLGELGKGDCVLVVASDLHQEAPLWWLRVTQAAKRGATIITVNPRPTKLDHFAQYKIRYVYGEEVAALEAFQSGQSSSEAASAFAKAENKIIFYGNEGLGLKESAGLAQACVKLLEKTGYVHRPKNGLIPVWPDGNTQGAWDMGFRPVKDLDAALLMAEMIYVAAADPVGDDPRLASIFRSNHFVVVQDLFLTETAKLAHVVLPAQPYTEREGTYTSGERRVQRYYPVVTPLYQQPKPDFAIVAQIAQRLGRPLEADSPSTIFQRIASQVTGYGELNYACLAETVSQWPLIGRRDLYYGGTAYENSRGLGETLDLVQDLPHSEILPPYNLSLSESPANIDVPEGAIKIVPVSVLFDRGSTLLPSTLLKQHLTAPSLWLHPDTAAEYHCLNVATVQLILDGFSAEVELHLDDTLPLGVGLVPRSTGVPLYGPLAARIEVLHPEKEGN